MSADPETTRIVRSWLGEGVTQLPDRVLDAVLDQLPATAQRRTRWWPAWRHPGRTAVIGVGVAVIVLAALLGFRLVRPMVGDPPPPTSTAFVSERFGYRLDMADDTWTVVERPGEWPLGTTFTQESAGIDLADRVGPEPYVLIASQPVPRGMGRVAWLAQYDEANAGTITNCGLESYTAARVDGEEARVGHYVCNSPGGHRFHAVDVAIVRDERAYVVRVFDPAADLSFDPKPLLDEFLAALRFTR